MEEQEFSLKSASLIKIGFLTIIMNLVQDLSDGYFSFSGTFLKNLIENPDYFSF
jgi:hypothetical protein